MFAACAEEEIVKVDNTAQEMKEVVGANLIGSNLSMNAYFDGAESHTRYADGNQGWGEGDEVGLGWLICKDLQPNDTQKPSVEPGSSYLWANHMFDTQDNGETWSTKGNVYEGWYFAYYPWSYEKKVGSPKKVMLNPAMVGKGSALHMSQSLYLSNNQFLSMDDAENGKLEKAFEMYQAVKFIQIKTNGTGNFAEGGKFQDLAIEEIKITNKAGGEVFATEAVLYGKNLPVKVEYPEDATADDKAAVKAQNLANFRNAYSSIVVATKKSSTLSRNVAKAGHTVSAEKAYTYLNVIPEVKSLNPADIEIEIACQGAKFVIDYAKTNQNNKDAIDAFVNAFQKGGVLSTINEKDEEGNPVRQLSVLKLNLDLTGDDFVVDFSAISDIDEWNTAVNWVNDLGRTSATFMIDGDIVFENEVNMPTVDGFTTLTVLNADSENPKNIVLTGEHVGLVSKLNVEAVDVVNEGKLTNAESIKSKSLTNNGTIVVSAGTIVGEGKEAVVTKNVLYNVVNNGTIKLSEYAEVNGGTNNGLIEVVYGAFVDGLATTSTGKISYMVKPADKVDPFRVKRVINDYNAKGAARVNTLVFKAKNEDETDNITSFDFTYTNPGNLGTYDPYEGVIGGKDDEELTWDGVIEQVDLDIDGVNVYSSKGTITVNDVTLANANLVQNVVVGGNLTINEGKVNVVSTIGGNLTIVKGEANVEAAIGGNVTVEKDVVEANIKTTQIGALAIKAGRGTITAESTIASVNIEAGNYTVNANTINGDVNATGENYFNVATFKGNVTLNNTSSTAIAFNDAKFEKDVNLKGTYGLVNTTINGDLTIDGDVKVANVTVGGDVLVKNGTVTVNNANIKGDLIVEAGSYTLSADEYTTIKNIVVEKGAALTANSDVYVNTIAVYGHVVVASGKVIWFTVPVKQNGYIQEGITQGKVLPSSMTVDGDNYTISGADGMEALAALVNAGTSFAGKTITLSEDIDLKDIEWEPIGTSDKPFMGTFDGANKSIKNLVIDNGTTNNTGLFGYVAGSKTAKIEVKNVVLENVSVKGGWRTGGLIGTCGNHTTVENITVKGLVQIEGYSDAGTVVGATCKTIKGINVEASEGSYVKSAAGTVGGVAGLLIENYHAENITSNINVIATNVDGSGNNPGVGGIFGTANGYGSKLTNCKSSGNVTIQNATTEARAMKIGGIVGGKQGGKLTLVGCEYTGQLASSFNGTAIEAFYSNSLVGDNTANTVIQ